MPVVRDGLLRQEGSLAPPVQAPNRVVTRIAVAHQPFPDVRCAELREELCIQHLQVNAVARDARNQPTANQLCFFWMSSPLLVLLALHRARMLLCRSWASNTRSAHDAWPSLELRASGAGVTEETGWGSPGPPRHDSAPCISRWTGPTTPRSPPKRSLGAAPIRSRPDRRHHKTGGGAEAVGGRSSTP